MAGNSRAAVESESTVERDLAALEQLPAPLRRAAQDFHVPVLAESFLRVFRRMSGEYATQREAVEATLRLISGSVDRELSIFDQQHRDKHGYALPHLAAHASVQRYGDWDHVPAKNRPTKFSPLRR